MGFLRRHGWWLLPELLVVAVLTSGLVHAAVNGLDEQLAGRAQTVLEQLPPAELELYDKHGHVVAHGAKVLCTAEPFGMEPPGAGRIEEVRVVYAHYLCALVQDGTPWDYASRSSGPAIITLAPPSSVRIVRSGFGFPERVRAMIPDDLESKAFAGFTDRDRPRALLARYNAEVS